MCFESKTNYRKETNNIKDDKVCNASCFSMDVTNLNCFLGSQIQLGEYLSSIIDYFL